MMALSRLRPWLLGGAFAVLAVLSGCAPMPSAPPAKPKVSVVLLPQKDAQGQPINTAVEVKTGPQSLTLDQPFALAESNANGQLSQRTASADEVQARYADLLRVQPPSAERVTLNFLPNKAELTPESEQQLAELILRARVRAGGEIVVVGHTDRTGTLEQNDALSLKRAQAIAARFKAQGFPEALITAVGRGEREPLIPTADEVEEPRNRRADVIIR